ncbi:MAG TPA: response regulator transcription factor [Phycisphaerae bacterium]|nr:response regulator transcription factor [Phycisphaerae bacterium]HOB73015.1 response regulator transcription factor [Phycisphaerae bacterium]HOJ52936.1 response regulator transcription factor [Phycisphaerae bacterium]HOL24673.1 response regulator transcription factor [Phycisphaerae bacterium]HPP19209.1 response regulator transcription factor [Phycisphaerae bacterium]
MDTDTILIIEDDPTLLRVLKDNFAAADYAVHTATDGEEGLAAARRLKPALIILDIMLPRINGYEVCRLLRRDKLDAVIIMLTAKGLETDVILGLNLGADDYVTKPFSIRELLARANAFLRRRRAGEQDVRRFGEFELDLRSHRLLRAGQEVPLTPKEYDLLALFVRRAGRALTRDQILEAVWGDAFLVTGRSVDRCINSLRRKLEPDPHHPVYIQTVREVGYRFDLPDA